MVSCLESLSIAITKNTNKSSITKNPLAVRNKC